MKIRLLRLMVVIIGFSLLAACASTKVRSQSDPQLAGRTYHKILVFVNFDDLAMRQDAELQFRTTLAANRVEAVPSSKFFFPGRTYSTEEAQKMLEDAKIEAILAVGPAGAGTTAHWMPQTTTTNATTTGTATVTGNRVSGQATSQATTRTSGGYHILKPWAKFDASLFDITSAQNVWIASMSSRGNAFASWGLLARSMAKRTSAQLVKDRILK